eukprot:COSAG06_NODE_4415_length_4288_cov_2.513965_4_plen_148_part_00
MNGSKRVFFSPFRIDSHLCVCEKETVSSCFSVSFSSIHSLNSLEIYRYDAIGFTKTGSGRTEGSQIERKNRPFRIDSHLLVCDCVKRFSKRFALFSRSFSFSSIHSLDSLKMIVFIYEWLKRGFFSPFRIESVRTCVCVIVRRRQLC